MKTILLIGVGRFGRKIANQLAQMDVQVMAVDKKEDRVQAVSDIVTRAIVGDASKREFLESIGVSNFDACIVAIGDDFLSSLEVTSLLKEEGAVRVVSRAARDTQEKFLLRNGADEVVYPEKQMANWTAIRVGSENVFDYLELAEGYGIYEILVPDKWIGRSIGELDIRSRYNLNILAVKDADRMDIAVGTEYVFAPGQAVLALGSQTDIRRCFGK